MENTRISEMNKKKTSSPKYKKHWAQKNAEELYQQSFPDLMFQAQTIHRQNFNPNIIEKAQLLSIKTGGCPEDCSYCSQSVHSKKPIKATKLMDLESTLQAAQQAKKNGATRFCMGAAWRSLKNRDMDKVCDLISEVKSLGLETCVTLGMINEEQAKKLKQAGLDFYNHNVDTSAEYYKNIITTRTYQDRIDTLEAVRTANISICSGGILGLGENPEDRISMLVTLANLPEPPHSVPINALVPSPGTKLGKTDKNNIDPVEFVKIIALARIMMPNSVIRLSAGRENMSESLQTLCFLAGANSIFIGEKLLTTKNASINQDHALFEKLGITGEKIKTDSVQKKHMN